MGKILTAVLVTGLTFVGAARPLGPDEGLRSAFCPECWRFRSGPSSTDFAGLCSGCGKTPVEVDSCVIPWHWCAIHQFWHRMPCEESKRERCLTLRGSVVLVIPQGQETPERRRYCPECRTFPTVRGACASVCQVCGKPTILFEAVERTWYWCKQDLQWREEPCLDSSHSQCCSARTGFLPVRVRKLDASWLKD